MITQLAYMDQSRINDHTALHVAVSRSHLPVADDCPGETGSVERSGTEQTDTPTSAERSEIITWLEVMRI